MRWRLGRSRSVRRTLIDGHCLVEVEIHSDIVLKLKDSISC